MDGLSVSRSAEHFPGQLPKLTFNRCLCVFDDLCIKEYQEVLVSLDTIPLCRQVGKILKTLLPGIT